MREASGRQYGRGFVASSVRPTADSEAKLTGVPRGFRRGVPPGQNEHDESEHGESEHERADDTCPQSIVVVLARQEHARSVAAIGTVLGHESVELDRPAEHEPEDRRNHRGQNEFGRRHLSRSVGRCPTRQTRLEANADKAPSGLEPLYEALQASA
jgi:hypothetical protein